jgi:hypothetical protein
MEALEKNQAQEINRPACFGNEAKFVAYMEGAVPDSECPKCPSENECGEYILLKCSRELMF